MEKQFLKVRMLGTFSMEYENRQISFERNTQTKINQLLQVLFHAGERGIAREELLQHLFGREEVANPSNSLRATVFRLRKLLVAEGFQENDEFVHIKKGIYRWTSNIPLEVDAVLFENKAKEALETIKEEQRYIKLTEVCELYKGDFLPQLGTVEWVMEEASRYKNLYKRCMKALCQLLKTRREYQLLYQVAAKAVELYPYDEWQIWQIDSLIAQSRTKEAIRLYEETTDMMFREMGIFPSRRMMERMAQMSSEMPNRVEMLETIRGELTEREEIRGAFYCSYPIFIENYRYIKRIISRSGQQAYLMLCTITDGKGYSLEKGERLERFSEEVGAAIQRTLRKGDLYTRYSSNQYLILLLDVSQEDCRIVIDRINKTFENPNRKNYLKYNVSSLDEKESYSFVSCDR